MESNQLIRSIKYVVDHADFVHINEKALDAFVDNFQPTRTDHWIKACPFDYRELPRREDEIDRRFLQDALAFCFWGYPTKWTIEYQGKSIDGWWALLASVQSALELEMDITDGHYLADLSFAEAGKLFAGNPQIPLFEDRIEILHEIGHTLVDKYQGHFHNFLHIAPHNATEFIEVLSREFPTFDDVSIYKGEKVCFYKKAQLLVDELADELGQKIAGVQELTGKADYKIHALLRKLGILEYEKSLAAKVNSRTELPADSPEEIEIRASMLWANHLICEKLQAKGMRIYPMQLDGILWVKSQTKSPEDKPYHLTLTTDY